MERNRNQDLASEDRCVLAERVFRRRQITEIISVATISRTITNDYVHKSRRDAQIMLARSEMLRRACEGIFSCKQRAQLPLRGRIIGDITARFAIGCRV